MRYALVAMVVVALVSLIGAGWLAVRGIGLAAETALEWLRPAVIASLPAGLAPAEIEARLDHALAAARDGQVDASVLREIAVWLPGALLDGRLDADETALLRGKLERAIGGVPPSDARG